MSGLAATLRAAEAGTHVRLLLTDGSEVSGELRGVHEETVDIGGKAVELQMVKRLGLEFGSIRERPRQVA